MNTGKNIRWVFMVRIGAFLAWIILFLLRFTIFKNIATSKSRRWKATLTIRLTIVTNLIIHFDITIEFLTECLVVNQTSDFCYSTCLINFHFEDFNLKIFAVELVWKKWLFCSYPTKRIMRRSTALIVT